MLILSSSLISVHSLYAQEYKLRPQETIKSNPVTLESFKFSQEKIIMLRKASLSLEKLAKEHMPKHLDKRQTIEANKYSKWLLNASSDFNNLANRWKSELRTARKINFNNQQVSEMNRAFSLQALSLQQKMQTENRKFTVISNIMKTKHDTAKSVIKNVR